MVAAPEPSSHNQLKSLNSFSVSLLTGVTPHQYLITLRLRRAATALRTTSEPVAATAFELGFGDLSTFNARFAASSAPVRSGFGAAHWFFSAVPSARRNSNFPQAG